MRWLGVLGSNAACIPWRVAPWPELDMRHALCPHLHDYLAHSTTHGTASHEGSGSLLHAGLPACMHEWPTDRPA